jgi:NAD(P)-dependent dehydrogenase (short-subunit alcohol dehydrogenase family)
MLLKNCTLIIGATSGIGEALTDHLRTLGEKVIGTSRSILQSENGADESFTLDVSSLDSINSFVRRFSQEYVWERLVFCPAVMSPIGPFGEVNIDEWVSTFNINFTNQVYLLRKLLPSKGGEMPRVIFFAGGGTNSAPRDYSAYTISKIALIKLVELLNEEMNSVSFTIIGPGWVNTKIHKQSMVHGLENSKAFKETKRRIRENDFVSMEKVVKSIMWVLSQSKEIVGGRNFSTAQDPLDSDDFIRSISSDYHALKLRRHGNDFAKQGDSQ